MHPSNFNNDGLFFFIKEFQLSFLLKSFFYRLDGSEWFSILDECNLKVLGITV